MRDWLDDPSGMLGKVVPLVASTDEAASFVRYFADRGQVLTDGTLAIVLGTNEIAAILSFALEERAGRDVVDHYRFYGATPGEHGPAIQEAAVTTPVDHRWTDRLGTAGLAVVDRTTARGFTEARWSVRIGEDFS